MNSILSKSAAVIHVVLLAAGMITSCGGSSETVQDDGQTAEYTAEAEETAAEMGNNIMIKDDLPDLDLRGRQINVLVREEIGYEFSADLDGEVVNDAVYERNRRIGERFNIDLNYVLKPGTWDFRDEYQKLVTGSVLAGDDAYQIVTGQSNIVLPLAAQNVFLDVSDPEYIDFSKPYWKNGYHDSIRINGRMYSLCGDYALTTLSETTVMFFNKPAMENRGLDYPYDSVKNGSWTLDKLNSLCAGLYEDINGDSVRNSDDFYGFSAYYLSVCSFANSLRSNVIRKNSEGVPVVNFPTEYDLTVFDSMQSVYDNEYFWFTTESDMPGEFMSENRMIIAMFLKGAEKLRNMDIDYGIIPYPKFDENQDDYVSSIIRRFTVAAVPITVGDPSISELVMEALACEGYNLVRPAYLEVALKSKYSRDAETGEMLDIISYTQYFDIADAFYSEIESVGDFMGEALAKHTGLSGWFSSVQKKTEKNLEKILENYYD